MLEMEIKSNIFCSRESVLAFVVNTFNVNRNTTALRNRTRGEWGVSEGIPVNILIPSPFPSLVPSFFFPRQFFVRALLSDLRYGVRRVK